MTTAMENNVTSNSKLSPNGTLIDESDGWVLDDATWILCASFIIFTMQTGFGMLESGCVSLKNEVNIMMKNVVDVVLGGVTYWAFGYGLSFGQEEGHTPFFGFGSWFVNAESMAVGPTFTTFLFQLSFATTATTIVSGGIAERCNFTAYCMFSLVNTVVYCLPAGWLWSPSGFLNQLGVVDIAGSGGVHLVGGVSAFVAAKMIGPRLGRWQLDTEPPMGSPTNAIIGLFMLWWGWLAFNSGSTFGISGKKWILASKCACITLIASFGGGTFSLFHTLYVTKGKIDVLMLINGILGSLVSITAGCAVVTSLEAIFIGIVGAFLANVTAPLLVWLRVDDAVGATCVHGFGGLWGMIAVGLFAAKDNLEGFSKYHGLVHGGGFYLLAVQALAVISCAAWAAIITALLIWVINKIVPFRMSEHEELIGADYSEHNIRHSGVGVSRALSLIKEHDSKLDLNLIPVGENKGHMDYLERQYGRNRQPSADSRLRRRLANNKVHVDQSQTEVVVIKNDDEDILGQSVDDVDLNSQYVD